ncbi:MAG TPA: F0F1 ATP synthase subunit A [Burkholderiales bacterium]|nr:F0F1 ATP synthase subunit A [Burkholderiales bacterium]
MGAAGEVLFRIGPLAVTRSVVVAWGIVALLGVFSALAAARLTVEGPGRVQAALEGIVLAIEQAIAEVIPSESKRLLPFIGTLWIFLVAANLAGVIPGLTSPTDSLSTTSALAVLVFLAVHWYGVRAVGLRRYLRHYLSPSPILLPFHVISELTRTIALAVRLFGNIMSLELAALLVLLVAGFLVPVPLLMLHIVEALVQAYIFGMLALVYIAGALQSQQERLSNSKE